MIHTLLLSAFTLLLLTGCSSRQTVRNSDDIRTLNQRGSESRARLLIAGGARYAGEWSGDAVTVAGDSVLWIDADAGTIRSAHITEVESIRFADHSAGFWQGLGFGALTGLGVGLIGSAMVSSEAPRGSGTLGVFAYGYANTIAQASMFTIGFTVPTLLGGVIGAGVGSRTYYTFPDTTLPLRDTFPPSGSSSAR